MLRALAVVICLAPAAALAQSEPAPTHAAGHAMQHMHEMTTLTTPRPRSAAPSEPGQSAFAAIQEIVQILEADPKTDWSKVDIDALRRHLADMNNVTLLAEVKTTAVDGGERFDVTGSEPVEASIRRMLSAHAKTMDGVDGWRFEAAQIDGGASLTVRPPAKDAARLRGLGFFGVITRGMHHQAHHLMLARGENPHE